MLSSHEEKVLNALINAVSDRQQLLANNLTNSSVPGYVRRDLDFGTLMQDLRSADNGEINQEIDINMSIDKSIYQDFDTPASYDSELSAMYENHLKYLLLTRINGHVYKHMEEATQSSRAA